jgi:hypothetical protein
MPALREGQLRFAVLTNEFLDAAYQPLDLAVPAPDPVGRPYAVNLPAEVFEYFLTETVAVAG